MKYLSLLIFISILFCTCDQSKIKAIPEAPQRVKKEKNFPQDLTKVFTNHGTLDKWNSMKTLSYEIVKKEGNEKQTIDLHSRAEKIEASNFISGFDGKEYWVEADTSYDGNAKFYTNLMFYFYAMPFVLADDGIVYTKVDPLDFEEKSYPGFRISYNAGVGVSPEDEYFIYYDPMTFEMAWLGYTVTYFSGEKSKKISYIRYDDWKQFNGIKLPNSLTWYKVEEGKIMEPRNTREFINVTLSDTALPSTTFSKTPNAKVVE